MKKRRAKHVKKPAMMASATAARSMRSYAANRKMMKAY